MNINHLTSKILQTHNILYSRTVAAINSNMTIRNWLIGAYIVEYEQNGEDRAKYGEHVITRLESSISKKKLKGFSATYLKIYRQFYLTYPHLYAVIEDFTNEDRIGQTASDQLELSVNYARRLA